MDYLETRKRILLGEPLWELDEEELRRRELMSGAVFNRVQNFVAMIPNAVILGCLNIFVGDELEIFSSPPFSPYSQCDESNKFPVLAFTLIVPIFITWLSPICVDFLASLFFPCLRCSNFNSKKMYLYLNAAHTMTAKASIIALGALISLGWGYFSVVMNLIHGDFFGASLLEIVLMAGLPLAITLALILVPIFLYIRFFLYRFTPRLISAAKSGPSACTLSFRREQLYRATQLAFCAILYLTLMSLPAIGHILIWISRCGPWDGLSISL